MLYSQANSLGESVSLDGIGVGGVWASGNSLGNTLVSMKTLSSSAHALIAAAITTGALGLGGCVSIVHGGNRDVALSSFPAGANVTISRADTGAPVKTGTTPMVASLDPKRGYFKGQPYTVTFDLAGYESVDFTVYPKMSGWYLGNILFGGVIGMVAVDPVTGSMWNLEPKAIEATLSAASGAPMVDTADAASSVSAASATTSASSRD